MGYNFRLIETKIHLPATAFPEALAAIRAMFGNGQETITDSSGPHYRWVETEICLAAKDLPEALEEWGYKATLDPATGDLVDLTFQRYKIGDEDLLFNRLAPYTTAGSYLMAVGEDDSLWQWEFDGQTCAWKDLPNPGIEYDG